ARVARNGLRRTRRREADEPHAARARFVALDVAFAFQRVQQVRHGLRRLDAKLSSDLADARLIRVLSEKVYQVVIDLLLQLGQWLRHGPPSACKVARRATCCSAGDSLVGGNVLLDPVEGQTLRSNPARDDPQ